MRFAVSLGMAVSAALISDRFFSWLKSWMSESSLPVVSSSRMRLSSLSRSSSDACGPMKRRSAVEHRRRREQLEQLHRAAIADADALAADLEDEPLVLRHEVVGEHHEAI